MPVVKLVMFTLILWLVLLFAPYQVGPATHRLTVCANGCAYTTIQAAIAAAVPDDHIDVAPGVYTEHLSLYDKRLTITGAAAATTILSGGKAGRVLFLYANTVLTLTNVTIQDGVVTGDQGGGIYNDGVLTLTASRVISNHATVSGGGIANFGKLLIDQGLISANRTAPGNGGGIVNGGQLTVTASTILDNYAQARGGGIYHSVGTLLLIDSTVAQNRADVAGGGLANFDQMTSINSTISANTTDGAGGGLVNGGRLQMTNLTIADNRAGDGNTLYNSGTLTVANTIMVDGVAGKHCTNWGIVNSQGHNLESDATCDLTALTDRRNTDPRLAPLADQGGPTPTQALLPDSPAVDAAGGACPPPATDQRGVTRPMGAACDIGAFEAESTLSAGFTWPTWARTARIAGAYFHPAESEAVIDARLDELAAQHVSVVVADTPWGEQYAAWVDDAEFAKVQALVATVVQKAHARGLKVVLYQVGLELTSPPERNPGLERPAWAQQSLTGQPVLYNDVSNAEEHWLDTGVWDFWVSPCAQTEGAAAAFRTLAFARVQAMVTTGIDGLWVDQVYLQSSVGSHHELWPSRDPCSAAAFQAATGFAPPEAENWDDPAFLQWVIWRHTQVTEFLIAEKAAARAVNPALVFLNENSSVDAGRATYVANDPTSYLAYPDLSTGHEVETIADRMDEGETGMQHATLDDWLAFRTMIAFARGADEGKPSWILTYGYQPHDSAQLAGLVLAEGANFYETKGPQMADTVDGAFRTQLFQWIADNESALYDTHSVADVGLLYSPRTRDLVDTVSGEPYDVQDSVHFAAYRAVAKRLYQAHIPFDVVIDTNTAAFARYRVLLVPEVQAMSAATLSALHTFTGTVLAIGESGVYDEWLQFRDTNLWSGAKQHHFDQVTNELITVADTGLIKTDAPPTVQLAVRRQREGYTLLVVNTASTPTISATLTLALPAPEVVTAVHFAALAEAERLLPFTFIKAADNATLHMDLPAGIATIALVTVMTANPVTVPTATPNATGVPPAPVTATLQDQIWLPLIVQ